MADLDEMMVAGNPWYRICACPVAHSCSRQALDRSKVWGWSEEEAKERFHHHLLNSSCHKDTFSDKYTVEDAIGDSIMVTEYVSEQEASRYWNQKKKKKEQQHQQQGADHGDGGHGGGGKRKREDRLKDLGSHAKASGPHAPDTPPPSHLVRGGASSSSRALALPTVDNRQVSIRVVELQGVMDAARRSSSAAKQAKRICESAARAFQSEAEVLDACVECFERALPPTFGTDTGL